MLSFVYICNDTVSKKSRLATSCSFELCLLISDLTEDRLKNLKKFQLVSL